MNLVYDISLDHEPTMTYCFNVVKKYYSKDGYEHALRVMNCVDSCHLIPDDYRLTCMKLALMHDLLEDTEYEKEYEISKGFNRALDLLTKNKEESYVDYILDLRISYEDTYYTKCAYYVKLMDIKDHLMQRKTLTDRLKNKYIEALTYLL